jgi:hypothetical protein
MSVRPITISEQQQGYGAPWTGLLGIFGASQGFLTHLRIHNLTIHSNWMPTAAARFTLPACVLGGAACGMAGGIVLFGSAELRRLSMSHRRDSNSATAITKYSEDFKQ